MGIHTFKLPDIGEGITEAEIAEWRVAVGDIIAEDQPLVDMLTDKAAVELPSPVAGKVVDLKGEAGEMVAVGAALVLIEVDGCDTGDSESTETDEVDSTSSETSEDIEPVGQVSQKAKPEPSMSSDDEPGTVNPTFELPSVKNPKRNISSTLPSHLPRPPGEKPLASPAVRRRAQELGIKLAYVHGTGSADRITQEDLNNYISQGSQVGSTRKARTGVEEIKIIGLRRKIAQQMERSKRRIPHFAYVEEVDVTELEKLRQHMNANRSEEQVKLTILPFLMQALVRVVPEFPMVNANYDDETGVLHRMDALHIGIAAQTDSGLVVPVVHHAETMDIWRMGSELKRLAEAARGGVATREELSGSSITISSLGPMGGIVSTPVINAPEVAIVGVNKMVERPMIVNGQVVPRMMMNLSSSFDHRIVDGWDAASFIQRIKVCLESPATLFI